MIPLLLVVVIDLIGFGIIIPLLPFYAETFGASPQKVTMLMVVFSLSQFVAAPIWGGLSDKYGRRLIIWVTLAGSILAYILLAYSNTLYGLFIARAFAGFMAGNISTAQAYLTDITTKENRAK
ncbi:MAG: MFS transporter, partial [Alphaproteobacteria bacterium]